MSASCSACLTCGSGGGAFSGGLGSGGLGSGLGSGGGGGGGGSTGLVSALEGCLLGKLSHNVASITLGLTCTAFQSTIKIMPRNSSTCMSTDNTAARLRMT